MIDIANLRERYMKSALAPLAHPESDDFNIREKSQRYINYERIVSRLCQQTF